MIGLPLSVPASETSHFVFAVVATKKNEQNVKSVVNASLFTCYSHEY